MEKEWGRLTKLFTGGGKGVVEKWLTLDLEHAMYIIDNLCVLRSTEISGGTVLYIQVSIIYTCTTKCNLTYHFCVCAFSAS